MSHPARTRPAVCRSASAERTAARATALDPLEEGTERPSRRRAGKVKKTEAPAVPPRCLHLLCSCLVRASCRDEESLPGRRPGQRRDAGCQCWSWTEAGALPGLPGRQRGIPGRRMWFLGLNGAWVAARGPWFVEAGLGAGSQGWG